MTNAAPMKPWRFSDGTVVHLGGVVDGDSAFAREVRQELARPDVEVSIWPLPGGSVPLDKNDPALLNAFLWDSSYIPRQRGELELVDAPDVPDLPPDPRPGENVPGRIY